MRAHSLVVLGLSLTLFGCPQTLEPGPGKSDPVADADEDGWTVEDGDCDDANADIHPDAEDTWYDGVDSDCAFDSDYDADGDGHDSSDYGEGGDCDDANADVNPDAEDTWYDGEDTDCGGNSDFDMDGDGHDSEDHDGDDCDDTDPAFSPSVDEIWYDGIDQDCDGGDDDDADADGFPVDEDCDDAAADVYPAAPETWYDGIDQDCYEGNEFDADSDGFDSAAEASDGTDCDDADAAVNPDATEIWYDGVDSDCDGLSDNDADADGHDSDAQGGDDCNDGLADISPSATEVCDGGVDNDCNGSADDADAGVDVTSYSTFYADADGDGFGDSAVSSSACAAPSGTVADNTDCNDDPSNDGASYYPGAPETCGDPGDYNCDGSSGSVDGDSDGYFACEECDDTDANVKPDATEVCDGIDNDCDGLVDIDPADGTTYLGTTWYEDSDGDGYGDPVSTLDNCDSSAPSGYVANANDCNDQATGVNPSAAEVCDALDTDEDCSGAADDNDAGVTGTTDWYPDADVDGFGDETDPGQASCEQPSGTVADNTDCNDDPSNGGANQFPGNTDIPQNGVDEDCSGSDALNGVSDLTTGDLVITEVMSDPSAVNNSDGEWFEIYNASGADVDLDGLVVSSTVSTATSFTVSGALSLVDGGYVVLGNNADAATNGGVTVDYEYGSAFSNLVNSGDDLTLNNGSIDIDSVSWECGGFRSAPGAAMALDVTLLTAADNDSYDSWCDADADIGSGDLGTPGAANAACTSSTPTYSYASDIHSLWSNNSAASCTASCHGTSGGLTLSGSSSDAFTELSSRVDVGCHETSLLWLKLEGTSAGTQMPKNASSTFSQSELDMISTWIDEGMNP